MTVYCVACTHDKQNRDLPIKTLLYSTTSGQKLHREPLKCKRPLRPLNTVIFCHIIIIITLFLLIDIDSEDAPALMQEADTLQQLHLAPISD